MRVFVVFLFCLYTAGVLSEINDPLIGRRHLVLDIEYVSLKRAANIHNKGTIAQLEDTSLVGGIDTNIADETECPHNTFRTIDLLKKQNRATGARITLNYLTNRKTTWQGRYLGFLHWHGSAYAACPNSLEFPFESGINNTVDYHDADFMKGVCDTRFWSAEANYWYHVTPRRVNYFSVSWVFGFRYFNFNEHFDLLSKTTGSASHYKIETNNRIGGPQIGGDFE